MFEFRFSKGHGWRKNQKFSFRHCNNGWHRFFEIIVPVKDKFLCDFIRYQITYWNNHTDFLGKEKINDSLIWPVDDRNDTQNI